MKPPRRHPSVCSYCRGDGRRPLIHQRTGVKVDSTDICHSKVVLGGKKTLDEIWRKTMRLRNLAMKGLGFSLTKLVYFIYK
jgi:hypothetical protein